MTACLLDGTSAAAAWRAAIAADARAVVDDLGYAPVLATVIAPGDPSSAAYARAISRACARAGVGSRVVELPNGGTDAELVACLRELNADDHVHGIIVQLPLPPAYTAAAVGATLAPEKDVDGVTPLSAGLLALGRPTYVPATPLGGMELLRHHGIGVRGMRATVVGRSAVIGRPLAMLLIAEGATVTVCHTATRDLGDACRNAEILFVAAGRRGLVDATMVTPGAVVVDFGTTVDGEGRLHGDVHFPSVSQVASWISPVPGGTLPMTTVALLRNTVESARLAASARAISRT
ncbi:MAG: bifunctional 5,10-methylenetetrahydrofolate dehydrogenase/5,10-methenyltetrahydrofolate cyclohydrolase [Chloroflexi bacterium]|jgi:methylenetetrahydrofolate dehydrogenase (NADP+)/methenyltetrahydrofolate cyclohydrolase|nr:bifunctional 5,10-methylenetetrahydrofolate dehydrogenase/5,10-methenyltetrahydrofolate cyclohydrolase [Chloroflexota bacterium]